MSTIEQRLTKLERRLRLYQGVILVLLLSGIFLVITSFDSKVADVISAKEFRVVDDNGKVYIAMKRDVDAGRIEVYANGSSIVQILKSDAGTGVVATRNKTGNLACRLGNFSTGDGVVQAYNSNNIAVAELGSTDIGSGYIGVKNKAGTNYLFKVTYTNDNFGGWMGLYNNNNTNTIRLSTTDNGCGSMEVYNSAAYSVVGISADKNNDGALNIYNRSNNRICVLAGDDNGNGVLNVYDTYGGNLNGVWHK